MEKYLLQLQLYIEQAGIWGPLIYMIAMIIAIIVSPIPSGPLAILAGTMFGWQQAFIWTIIGATIGAVIAFYIARILGRPLVVKLISEKQLKKVEDFLPEKRLTWIIFLSRIPPLPFFDAVSYASGLTKLPLQNFVLATFFGLMPMTFLLTYFGEQATDIGSLSLIIVTFSIALPFVIKWVIDYKKKKK